MEANSAYYARRAAEEQAAAERASDPRARRSHLELSDFYARAARREGCAATAANGAAIGDKVASITPADLRIL